MDFENENKDIEIDSCVKKNLSEVLKYMEAMRVSLDALCRCFLIRAKDEDKDPLWKRFYSIQMSSYLVSKKSLKISESEGDMIYDLIRDTWLDIKDYMEKSRFGPISNVDQWFKTIKIDFPVDVFDPDCVSYSPGVFLLCQNDSKRKVKDKTV